MSTCFTPEAAASAMISSSTGIIRSRPSIEKRVLPGKVRCRKRSNTSTWVMRSSSSRPSMGSVGGRNRRASTASRSHTRSSGTNTWAKSWPLVAQ